MSANERPYVLSIAGFDPSGGAGVLADIKAFEAQKVYGLGVCTAVTYQHEAAFYGVEWLSVEKIQKQLDPLLDRYPVLWAKIGLIESLEVLEWVVDYLREKNKAIQLVWDPVVRASAGFTFHPATDAQRVRSICNKLMLVTPNLEEVAFLVPGKAAGAAARVLAGSCNVWLKGGHREQDAHDRLFLKTGEEVLFEGERLQGQDKHGTGCVASSVIVAEMAKKNTLPDACRIAKEYINRYIKSNETLLGYHL